MVNKAVFFDIDGTLLDSSHGLYQMTEPVQKAIKQLQAQGDKVFIASGRPYAFLDSNLRGFGFDGYILMNGAVLIVDDKVIYEHRLSEEYVKKACAICEYNQVEYILEGVENVYLPRKFLTMRERYNKLNIPLDKFVYDFELTGLSVYKLEMLADDEKGKQKCMQLVTAEMEYMQDARHDMHFELYAKNESKASGMLKILDKLGVDVKDSCIFGDGKNDIEIFRAAGLRFAMGNAVPEIKAIADYILPPISEDGVAAGINRYLLNK